VAAAFNDAKSAEKELRAVQRVGEHKDRLANMYFTLNRLYYRNRERIAKGRMRWNAVLALAGQDSDRRTGRSLRSQAACPFSRSCRVLMPRMFASLGAEVEVRGNRHAC